MMHSVFGFRSAHDGSVEQIQDGSDIVRIGSGNMNGQRCSSLIHQKVAFRAGFGSIRGIRTGEIAS